MKVNRLTRNSEYKKAVMNSFFLLAFVCMDSNACKFGQLEQNACKSKWFNIYVDLKIIAVAELFNFVSTVAEIAKDLIYHPRGSRVWKVPGHTEKWWLLF